MVGVSFEKVDGIEDERSTELSFMPSGLQLSGWDFVDLSGVWA